MDVQLEFNLSSGWSSLYWNLSDYSLGYYLFVSTLFPFVWQSVLEYYWHRTMHLPWFYIRLHKVHHYYKSPEPFDDLYIHPLESFGYYCILYSPAFIIPVHVTSFIFYMSIVGLTGVLDHSGVYFSFPGFYNTRDHDTHHAKFDCNYAFPFPFMDLAHGTFRGTYLNKEYCYKKVH
eukprot:TRINITY_DN1958_c0_g1_i5.p1 TRINITY_DN1958_c0_g1~~TRINITY_DN1958_c0_g1_i5.p1  ORF type:complete len:176 (-),score=21.97 TRINITY_DN1958_c0_g1_i5:12-539(-)